MAGVDRSWQAGPDFNTAVKQFHDRCAREPEMGDAKRLHQLYMEDIRRVLVERGVCSRLEYTGSAYEGTKVRRSDTDRDLEFDIMVIRRCEGADPGLQASTAFCTEGMTKALAEMEAKPSVAKFTVVRTGKPGYIELRLRGGADSSLIRKAVDKNGLLLPVEFANQFHGELQRCLNQCQQEASGQQATRPELCHIKDRVKLRRHGPAVQMDVMQGPQPSTKFYSVDMVPAIEIPRGNGKSDYYVAKPIKGSSSAGSENAWRKSFSLEEKNRLVTADDGNLCRKQIFRILKVIRNREAALTPLTSYHLKTVLFRKMDELSGSAHWKIECIGQRLMDVIGQMEKELGNKYMPHYYIPEFNLLETIPQQTVDDMRYRLKRLMNSKEAMMKLLRNGKQSIL